MAELCVPAGYPHRDTRQKRPWSITTIKATRLRYGGDPAGELASRQAWVSNVFLDQFNLQITHNTTPPLFWSLPDLCKTKRGLEVDSTTINELCPVPGTEGYNPNCTGWTELYGPFISARPGSDYKPTVLWTGNRLEDNRSYTWYNHGISIQGLHSSSSRVDGERFSLLHEEAHQFGAPDHYCNNSSKADCGNRNCPFHYPASGYTDECAMGQYIGNVSAWPQDSLFCKYCATDILNHLASEHHN